jgi:hypothetical protein
MPGQVLVSRDPQAWLLHGGSGEAWQEKRRGRVQAVETDVTLAKNRPVI